MLLALAVFSAHAGDLFGLHWISARHCFFAFSGFFIHMLLNSPARTGGNIDFWIGRFVRLYPLYLLVLAGYVAVVLGAWLADGTWIGAAGRLANSVMPVSYDLLTAFASLTMLGLNIPSSSHIPSGPLWALGAEMSFYLVAPWLLRQSTMFLWVVLVTGLTLMLSHFGNHLPVGSGISFFLMGRSPGERASGWMPSGGICRCYFDRHSFACWPISPRTASAIPLSAVCGPMTCARPVSPTPSRSAC